MDAAVNIGQSNREKLLADWKAADDARLAAVQRERELREMVIAAYSEVTDEMHSGTESVDIGWGHDLKIEHKLDYRLGAKDLVDNALDEIEKSCENGELLAERLVNWKPEISVREYKMLPDAAKKIINRVLTIKPASKSVKIHKRGK